MKKIICLLCVATVIFSCKKAGPSLNVPPTDSLYYLSSIRSTSPQTLVIDSLIYDSSQRIASLLIYAFDTSGAYTGADSIRIDFNLSPSGPPASYVFTDYVAGPANDLHQLTYDDQNRVIEDTSLSGTGYINHFSYPANEITSSVFFTGTSNFENSILDTLSVSGGNIVHENDYAPNNDLTADSLEVSVNYGYSAYPNPAYNPKVASTIGPLLFGILFYYNSSYSDAISKKTLNNVSGLSAGLPPGGFNYAVVSDAKGRVSELKPDVPGIVGEIRFSYYP
ncbi:MAG TPA: hypothetical protein VKR32_20505 [Puia sp.]|nr:hypothetical protein [Puia sp.]